MALYFSDPVISLVRRAVNPITVEQDTGTPRGYIESVAQGVTVNLDTGEPEAFLRSVAGDSITIENDTSDPVGLISSMARPITVEHETSRPIPQIPILVNAIILRVSTGTPRGYISRVAAQSITASLDTGEPRGYIPRVAAEGITVEYDMGRAHAFSHAEFVEVEYSVGRPRGYIPEVAAEGITVRHDTGEPEGFLQAAARPVTVRLNTGEPLAYLRSVAGGTVTAGLSTGRPVAYVSTPVQSITAGYSVGEAFGQRISDVVGIVFNRLVSGNYDVLTLRPRGRNRMEWRDVVRGDVLTISGGTGSITATVLSISRSGNQYEIRLPYRDWGVLNGPIRIQDQDGDDLGTDWNETPEDSASDVSGVRQWYRDGGENRRVKSYLRSVAARPITFWNFSGVSPYLPRSISIRNFISQPQAFLRSVAAETVSYRVLLNEPEGFVRVTSGKPQGFLRSVAAIGIDIPPPNLGRPLPLDRYYVRSIRLHYRAGRPSLIYSNPIEAYWVIPNPSVRSHREGVLVSDAIGIEWFVLPTNNVLPYLRSVAGTELSLSSDTGDPESIPGVNRGGNVLYNEMSVSNPRRFHPRVPSETVRQAEADYVTDLITQEYTIDSFDRR